MTTTISMPGTISQITASIDVPTSQYGTPRPTLSVRVLGDLHHKAAQAFAHQVAAQVELALLARRCEAIVEIESGSGMAYEGRTRVGVTMRIALELVGDERRMPLLAEAAIARDALAEVASRLNAAK